MKVYRNLIVDHDSWSTELLLKGTETGCSKKVSIKSPEVIPLSFKFLEMKQEESDFHIWLMTELTPYTILISLKWKIALINQEIIWSSIPVM